MVFLTIYLDPVGLDSRNNFSCFAFNEGGNGTAATINIDIQVAPWFINKLPPYTGFLYSEPAINLTCRVECVPSCSIYWFKDGEEISSINDRYAIREVLLPADTSTGDFESVLSELVSFVVSLFVSFSLLIQFIFFHNSILI